MDVEKKEFITPPQLVFLIEGILVGVYIFRLPSLLVKTAYQDAWISVLVASVYPFYIVAISNYIIKRHPEDILLKLSNKYMGKTFGTIMNCIFLLQFIFLTSFITVSLTNLITVYGNAQLNPIKIIAAVIIISAYAASKGLRVLAKVNEFIFILTAVLLLFSVIGLFKGSILNVMPVFDAGYLKIIRASKDAFYSFLNIEILLLLHPYVKNKRKIKRASYISLALTIGIYVWVVFITIYYGGIYVVPKNIWSFVMVTQGISTRVVTNFTLIFVVLWNLIQFKIVSSEYFFSTFCITQIININRKKLCYYLILPFIGLSLLFVNQKIFNVFSDYCVPAYVIFNVVFITIIALLILIKGKKSKKNKCKNEAMKQ